MTSFLGTGWRFPILPDDAGRLAYATSEESVEHCLRALLLTGLGDRVMRPDLGTRVPSLVFAPGSIQYLQDLEDAIREAVVLFEPRVELESVQAEQDPGNENCVSVSVVYQVRSTNTRGNLVFPYYLGIA